MDTPDPRKRSKVALNPRKVLSTPISKQLISPSLLLHTLFAFTFWSTREWIFMQGIGAFWVIMRLLACIGLGVMVREAYTGGLGKLASTIRYVDRPVVAVTSATIFVQQASLVIVLSQLPPSRALVYTRFATVWSKALVSSTSTLQRMSILASLSLSFASDSGFSIENVRNTLPGYMALFFYTLSVNVMEYLRQDSATRSTTRASTTLGTIGASLLGLILYAAREIMTSPPPSPVVPLSSLLIIPLLSYCCYSMSSTQGEYVSLEVSYNATWVLSTLVGFFIFSRNPSWTDIAIAATLLGGIYRSQPQSSRYKALSITREARSYLKSIMENSESRKIFYFLLLNLCYMMVQMLYGIWTNSLGLISDAIHMGFDCLAIAVGLLASVMATWPPNERFTYGYARIETLSGFANGIFLVLISIFIIFEAIERLLDPPEMNTNQLLLVSSLGLGVNLFGMFAMGGHHHHGHSHGHSHGHEHEHDHSHGHEHHDEHGHEHHDEHGHEHHDEHVHHHHAEESQHEHSHGDIHVHEHDHSCDHSHDDEHHHNHEGHGHEHEHAHSHDHGHAHSHDHEDDHHGHYHGPSAYVPRPSISLNESPSPSRGSIPRPLAISPHNFGPASHSSPDVHDESMEVPSLQDSVKSPITPSYRFGHDEHFATHEHSQHKANLHDHSHTHDHHSHEGHSHNMRGVFLHVMADTLGSLGVIISTLLIQSYGWTGFDPIASLFIAILIAASVIPLIIDTGKVLALDVSERDASIGDALSQLSSIEGLISYTSPQFWPKDSSSLIGSIHIQQTASSSSKYPGALDRITEGVDSLLRKKIPGLEELTIQVEEADIKL